MFSDGHFAKAIVTKVAFLKKIKLLKLHVSKILIA